MTILYHIVQVSMKEPLQNLTTTHFQKFEEEFLPKINQTWLIVVQEKSIGRLRLENNGDSVHIGGIQILPEFQNLGIGSDILDKLIIDTKQQSLTLNVHKTNTKAIKFYISKKFEIISETLTQYKMKYS
jgi:ribosomal protein S18 acetylase RimI-like enzyme